MRKTGIEPIIVVEILYPDGSKEYHAMQEIPKKLNPLNVDIQGTISQVGPFSQTTEVDGFGSVGSVSIIFNDFTGQFKYMLEHTDLYTLKFNIILLIRESHTKYIQRTIMTGKAKSPIDWKEEDRSLNIDIVSNIEYRQFGFQPSFEEHMYLQLNLANKPWPHIFGNVTYASLGPVINKPSTRLIQNFVWIMPNKDGAYPPEFSYLDFTGETVYLRAKTDTCTDFAIDPEDYDRLPPKSFYGGNYEGNQEVDIQIEGGSIRAYGYFQDFGAGPIFKAIDFNIPLYNNIVAWSPPQFETQLAYEEDNQNYYPNIITMLGYGSFTPSSTFNIHGDLESSTTITVPFPIEEYHAGGQPWLKDKFIRFHAVSTSVNMNDEYEANWITLWAKVVDQNGLVLWLDEIMDEEEKEFSLSGYSVTFIELVINNKLFKPGTQDPYETATIKSQRADKHKRKYEPNPVTGEKHLSIALKQGAEISLVNWWPTLLFPVTLDVDTSINHAYIKHEGQLYPLNPLTDYNVIKYSFSEEDGHTFIVSYGTTNEVVPEALLDMVNHFSPDECPYLPREVTFIILAPLAMFQDVDNIELVVSAINEYDTDEKVFQKIIELYTDNTFTINPNLTKHRPINICVQESQEVKTWLANLAFEHGKAIQLYNNQAILVDLLAENTAKRVINEGNTEQSTLTISYSDVGDVKNIFKCRGSWTKGQIILRDQASIDKHDELVENIEIVTNRKLDQLNTFGADPYNLANWISTVDDADPRGYNVILYWWLNYYANVWQKVTFKTFLDVFLTNDRYLLPNDYLLLDYQLPLTFLENEGLPLIVHPDWGKVGGNLPNGVKGRIEEITLNPTDWSVEITVITNTKIGEE